METPRVQNQKTENHFLLAEYVRAGFSLVPIPKGVKGPLTQMWNHRDKCISDEDGLSLITHNVGLAHVYCSPVTCSIDVDDFVLAKVWLANKGVDLDGLLTAPDAVQIVSGKANKAKLIYKLPISIEPLIMKQIKSGGTPNKTILEFRCASRGGLTVQDVLPPSIHPDTGKPYEWGGAGHFSRIPEIPQALLSIWQGLHLSKKPSMPANFALPERPIDELTKNLLGFPETPENIQRVRSALSHIAANCSYPEWRDILFALKSTLWVCAEDLGRNWSKTAPEKWDPKVFDQIWRGAKALGGITIGTLLHKGTVNGLSTLSMTPEALFRDASISAFEFHEGRMKVMDQPPPKREYVFGDSVLRGTTCMLAGLGGTAKTTFVMQLAINGALGKNLGNFSIGQFSSVMILGEENEAERDRRFGALCSDLSSAERGYVENYVLCYPAAGKDIRLNWMEGQNLLDSPIVGTIIDIAKRHQAECGLDLGLIVLDHARLVMSGDPNAANDVTQLTRILTKIAIETDAAVMLLAHSPKSSMGKEAEADASEIFGSGAFVDNARTAFVLNTMRPKEAKDYGISDGDRNKYVCLSVVKANYGETGKSWWFKKELHSDWQAVELKPELLYSQKVFSNHNHLSMKLIDLIQKKPAQLSERKIRDIAGTKGELKASEAEVLRSLDRLEEEGVVIKRSPTPEERKLYGISSNTKVVYVQVSTAE